VIEIEVESPEWTTALADCEDVVRRAARAALKDDEPAITVLLTDDAALKDLNARFRGKASATNVLSFPAAASAQPHLGDIALAYGVCAAEGRAAGKPLAHHLMHLTVHGVLHLLGYDHVSDAEAEEMEGVERDILATLGVPDPYAQLEDRGQDAGTM